MKKRNDIFLIVISALLAALVACTKMSPEVEPDGPAEEDGGRIITAVFSSASKSTLNVDGLTPKFRDGDLIKVSNTTAFQVCTIKVSGNVAFFKTTLTGALKAVYPEEAAAMNAAGTDITGVKVPSSQNGRFEKANIAMATIPAGGRHATFENQTAILRFYVDKSIGVSSLSIKTSGTTNIANDGVDLKVINVSPISGDISTFTADNPDPRICYIAILSGINANTLTFTSHTTTQDVVERECPTNAVLKKSGMYDAFIPYYIDLGTGGKWGYCNVGAFLPEEAGWHFSWGNVTGYVYKDSKWVSAADGSQLSGGFSSDNYTSSSGHSLTGNIPVDAAYDAAFAHWGEGWRMPTGGPYADADFVALFNACKVGGYTEGSFTPDVITDIPTTATRGVYYYNVSGGKGLYFVNDEGEKLFLPVTGFGNGNSRNNYSFEGDYWSSTQHSENGCDLDFTSSTVRPRTWIDKRYGCSIRPIYSTLEFEIEKYNDPIDI